MVDFFKLPRLLWAAVVFIVLGNLPIVPVKTPWATNFEPVFAFYGWALGAIFTQSNQIFLICIFIIFSLLIQVGLSFLVASIISYFNSKIQSALWIVVFVIVVLIILISPILAYDYYTERRFYDPALSLIAAVEGDGNICHGILGKYDKEYCYEGVAATNGDSDLCQQIATENIKNFCLMDAAVARKDVNACSSIQSFQREGCYYKLAQVLKDPTICDNIGFDSTNQFQKDDCKWSISLLTNTLCNQSSTECDSFFENAAKSRNNIGLCNEIIYQSTREACQARFMHAAHDSEACLGIQNVAIKSECLSGASDMNVNICGQIEEPFWKGLCYINLASIEADDALCGNIEEKAQKEQCELNVREAKPIIRKCENQKALFDKNLCYIAYALELRNFKWCLKIIDANLRAKCIDTASQPVYG
jgi:hypothetical protein